VMSRKNDKRVRKEDEVYVLSGKYAESTGKVIELLRDSNRVRVEIKGLDDEDKVIKHQKRSQEFPNGTKRYLNPTVHVSNVMKLSRWNERKGGSTDGAVENE